jgi:hypothetical protein
MEMVFVYDFQQRAREGLGKKMDEENKRKIMFVDIEALHFLQEPPHETRLKKE